MEAAVSARDAQRLRALHDEYAGPLWSFVVHLTGGDSALAQDVVQETLLRAWRQPEILAQTRGSARSWLFTVARRIVIDEWRSGRSRHEVVAAALPELSDDDRTDALLDTWLVEDALQQLSPDHRAVLIECYYRGCTTAEAARMLQIPDGTVKSRLHYALRALRLALQERGVTA